MTYLIGILFFLLPFQTQWIIRYGSLNGQSWEFGTIGIFATDILLLFILTLSLRAPRSPSGGVAIQKKFPIVWTTMFVLFVLANLLVAVDHRVALLHTLWLIEAGIVAWLVSRPQHRSISINSFIAGSVVQALIGLWQFFSQSTVASTLMGWAAHPAWQSGTSVIEREGERWLRAYGGLPHPNIFGGWMAVAIIIVISQYSPSLPAPPWRWSRGRRSLMSVALVLLSAGLAVSFSRSAWIATAIGVAFFLLSFWRAYGEAGIRSDPGQARMTIATLFIILLSFCATLLPYRHLFSTRVHATARLEQQSLNERVQGYQDAFVIIREHPFLGVGMGIFTPSVASENPQRPLWSIQPVHNVLVLIIAELGVVGLALIGVALYYCLKLLRQSKNSILYSLCSMLFVLALFDHYLWSLHTGLLLTGLIMGWIASKPFFARE